KLVAERNARYAPLSTGPPAQQQTAVPAVTLNGPGEQPRRRRRGALRRTDLKPSVRDKQTGARDKWIYDRCVKGIPYAKIRAQLKKKTNWDQIESEQGIRQAALRYAERKNLPRPGLRFDL